VGYEDDPDISPDDDDFEEPEWEDETDTDAPENQSAVMFKYQVEPDVPIKQKGVLDDYRPFYGRHTALDNTIRPDNPRILDAYDLATILDDCPTLRHRATRLRGRVLTELQLFRSNHGFERKMETTITKSMDIKDNRFTPVSEPEKKKRFSILRRKKK
jgi:hypothetical protein